MPRVWSAPDHVRSSGQDAIDLAESAGLILDPWQAFVLEHALGERDDGKWSAFEVGVMVPRQNGKGAIIEALTLAGLFLFDERLIIHSAHLFDTSMEAMRRLLELIESTPELEQRVKRVARANGQEGVELKGGQRVRFRARTKSGGRGLTGDRLFLDEAMYLPAAAIAALIPTLSARPNPQVVYTGSAVDRVENPDGVTFARLRERGVDGGDPSAAWFEWSLPAGAPEDVPADVAADPVSWRIANPAAGARIAEEHIANELRSLDARSFAVERLGVGDWPRTDMPTAAVIDPAVWHALFDEESQAMDPVWFGFDVSPTRSWATVAAAGFRDDGLVHAEVVDRRPGAGWLAGRIQELAARHKPAGVVCDRAGQTAGSVEELERAGVKVTTTDHRGMVRACGDFYDLVVDGRLRHLGGEPLDAAVRGAVKRDLGDAWAWNRRSSSVDITPLVAVTLAAGHVNEPKVRRPTVTVL